MERAVRAESAARMWPSPSSTRRSPTPALAGRRSPRAPMGSRPRRRHRRARLAGARDRAERRSRRCRLGRWRSSPARVRGGTATAKAMHRLRQPPPSCAVRYRRRAAWSEPPQRDPRRRSLVAVFEGKAPAAPSACAPDRRRRNLSPFHPADFATGRSAQGSAVQGRWRLLPSFAGLRSTKVCPLPFAAEGGTGRPDEGDAHFPVEQIRGSSLAEPAVAAKEGTMKEATATRSSRS